MNKIKTVAFTEAANTLMHDFLKAMLEITLDSDQVSHIDRAYEGDAHRNSMVSFSQTMD